MHLIFNQIRFTIDALVRVRSDFNNCKTMKEEKRRKRRKKISKYLLIDSVLIVKRIRSTVVSSMLLLFFFLPFFSLVVHVTGCLSFALFACFSRFAWDHNNFCFFCNIGTYISERRSDVLFHLPFNGNIFSVFCWFKLTHSLTQYNF